jgi:hypothetical protein
VRKDSRREEAKRKFGGEAKDALFLGKEKEHFVRRFLGIACSSF